PKDLIAFGFGATYVNDRVARGEALRDSAGGLSFVPIQGAEHEWELDYQAQVAPWLSLRPNLQVIQHPSGVASKSTAVVLGLKAGLAL
ncbi:carbohydrate porin, partial [Mycobacterium tuberculosis]